jgi:hypothetical protein
MVSPGMQPGQAIDPRYNPNMDEELGRQKNAAALARAQEYERQRMVNEYMQKFRRPSMRRAPDYTQGFNYTPEDLYMAMLGGYTLPAQGQVDYKMKSFTDTDTESRFRNW